MQYYDRERVHLKYTRHLRDYVSDLTVIRIMIN